MEVASHFRGHGDRVCVGYRSPSQGKGFRAEEKRCSHFPENLAPSPQVFPEPLSEFDDICENGKYSAARGPRQSGVGSRKLKRLFYKGLKISDPISTVTT
jgi:hypothetical protein